MPRDAAEQLYVHSREAAALQAKLSALRRLSEGDRSMIARIFATDRDSRPPTRYYLDRILEDSEPGLAREFAKIADEASSLEEFMATIGTRISNTQEKIEKLQSTEIATPIKSYTGDVKVPPPYAGSLMKCFGGMRLIHFRESKAPIGREEAQQLLALKVRRGGPEQLRSLQSIVKTLLGVSIDAFQGERGPSEAEMDIDEFLAEANGAGIREALRLVLDIELKSPHLILLEDPEVHLHPGLEFAVHGYLQAKSATKQMFVTTHSTNFVDAVS